MITLLVFCMVIKGGKYLFDCRLSGNQTKKRYNNKPRCRDFVHPSMLKHRTAAGSSAVSFIKARTVASGRNYPV
jgi:hypothetical protein